MDKSDKNFISVEKGIELLLKSIKPEEIPKFQDALIRIALRPRWNYTRTIVKRKYGYRRLWGEVQNYLTVHHSILSQQMRELKYTLLNIFEKRVGIDLATLYPLPYPPSRPGSTDCYRRWGQFQEAVLIGFGISLQNYIRTSLRGLNEKEREVIRVLLDLRSEIGDQDIIFSRSPYLENDLFKATQRAYQQNVGRDLTEEIYIQAIIKARLGDWADLERLCLFETAHGRYPPEFLLDLIKPEWLEPMKDAEKGVKTDQIQEPIFQARQTPEIVDIKDFEDKIRIGIRSVNLEVKIKNSSFEPCTVRTMVQAPGLKVPSSYSWIPLQPGETADQPFLLGVPQDPGEYQIMLSLVDKNQIHIRGSGRKLEFEVYERRRDTIFRIVKEVLGLAARKT